MRAGPYIIRAAGDALLARCDACGELFKLQDDPATRSRIYRGCTHCTNPEAHTHDERPEDCPCGHSMSEHDDLGCRHTTRTATSEDECSCANGS